MKAPRLGLAAVPLAAALAGTPGCAENEDLVKSLTWSVRNGIENGEGLPFGYNTMQVNNAGFECDEEDKVCGSDIQVIGTHGQGNEVLELNEAGIKVVAIEGVAEDPTDAESVLEWLEDTASNDWVLVDTKDSSNHTLVTMDDPGFVNLTMVALEDSGQTIVPFEVPGDPDPSGVTIDIFLVGAPYEEDGPDYSVMQDWEVTE